MFAENEYELILEGLDKIRDDNTADGEWSPFDEDTYHSIRAKLDLSMSKSVVNELSG